MEGTHGSLFATWSGPGLGFGLGLGLGRGLGSGFGLGMGMGVSRRGLLSPDPL